MDTVNVLLEPVATHGFMGFSVVLLTLIIWLIKRLLAVMEANNAVIAANTAATKTLIAIVSDLMILNRSLHDKIISRPCIAREE